MSPVQKPALPMPTKAKIRELFTFLAANVAVAKEDGMTRKAGDYQALLDTATALAERAVDLSEITRVVVVRDDPAESFAVESVERRLTGRAYDESNLYDGGCVIDVQDEGRTLKLLPTPKVTSFL